MGEENWHEARLIPTSGIKGEQEQERRATSALLAVMTSVSEFGRAMTKPLGAPAGKLSTYIEVEFDVDGKKIIPDGLIRVTRGSRSWVALVEVKTGRSELTTDQIEKYLDLARSEQYDVVLTISNEIPPVVDQHPTKVDKRKVRRVALHHMSWSRLLCEAVMIKEHRGVADPDQAWILGELIRYLEHPRSGALEFSDMGSQWVSVRQSVTRGTLRQSDLGVQEISGRWDALLRFASLKLGSRLGEEVTPVLTRKEQADITVRAQNVSKDLVDDGVLRGTVRIPNAVAPIVVSADLRSQTVTCHVDIDAPATGRALTRVRWITRQLSSAPEGVRLEAFIARSRGPGMSELLRDVRTDPSTLIGDPGKEIRSFRVAASRPLGKKQGRGQGTFIDSIIDHIYAFYGEIVQDLKAWRAAPPRMREVPASEAPPELSSTALSSQDGAEVAPS